MEIIIYCKMQLGYFILLCFIGYLFITDKSRLNQNMKSNKGKDHYFYILFILGQLALILDAATYYMVNHLDQVSAQLNTITHLAYLLVYQFFIFSHLIYWLYMTGSFPKKTLTRILLYIPIIVSVITTIVFIPKLHYNTGKFTNYSMGISAIVTFGIITFYSIMTLSIFFLKKNYIHNNKRRAFIMAFSTVFIITIIQMLYNETLVSSIAIILVLISIYLCMENPTIKYLELYHSEMVMGFSTLVESKDGSTGGHIHRSSAYAILIAKQLRKHSKYKRIITNDYIDNLKKAAPMHDIGKIGVPDSILQKPGKLTKEEFDIMKTHPEIGGKIIKETFGHLDDKEYECMAYDVAIGHHEKWNGKGYPFNKKETEIPLCARIMAVADVFDAISAKRCYRDALPLEECYEIIRQGRNEDFDPDIVDAFFEVLNHIEEVYHTLHD